MAASKPKATLNPRGLNYAHICRNCGWAPKLSDPNPARAHECQPNKNRARNLRRAGLID